MERTAAAALVDRATPVPAGLAVGGLSLWAAAPAPVLMDVRMPGMDGLTAAQHIAEASEPPKVVMLTTFDLDEYVDTALRAGAVGFLLKATPPRDLTEAVRTVAAGNAMLAPTVTRRLIGAYAESRPSLTHAARRRLSALTQCERQVAGHIARGLSNAEIGAEPATSEATVKAHVSHVLTKLGCANRVQVAILVHDAGEQ